jgi:hypothetical protein
MRNTMTKLCLNISCLPGITQKLYNNYNDNNEYDDDDELECLHNALDHHPTHPPSGSTRSSVRPMLIVDSIDNVDSVQIMHVPSVCIISLPNIMSHRIRGHIQLSSID